MVTSVPTVSAKVDFLRYEEQASSSTPASGFAIMYFKTDGLLYTKDDAGLETGPITNAAAVILDPDASGRNVIQPTGGDFKPLVIRGYGTTPSQPILQLKEGSTGWDIATFNATGGITLQNQADSTTALEIFDVAAAVTLFNVDTINKNVFINAPSTVSANYDLLLGGDGVLALKETTTPTADTNYGKVYTKSDNKLYFQDGEGTEHLTHGFPIFKSYTVTTQGLGANPDIYAAGFYDFAVGDPALDEGNLTQAIGAANLSHAAHAFIVTNAAGTVNTGVVGLKVTGISITDAGARNAGDEEVLLADITAATSDTYYETTKKWLGAPVFTLYIVSGSPTVFSLAINYGLVKYDDFSNHNFTVSSIEAVGLAGAADNDFDIKLLHHKATGWTYNNGAFSPIIAGNTIASLVGDHDTDDKLASNDHFAWKRTGLTTVVNGDNGEGIIIFISSTANSAIEYCNLHVGVDF